MTTFVSFSPPLHCIGDQALVAAGGKAARQQPQKVAKDLEETASGEIPPGAGGVELGVQSWWVFFIETTFRISPPVLKGRSSGFRIRALTQPNKQTNATNNKNAFEVAKNSVAVASSQV